MVESHKEAGQKETWKKISYIYAERHRHHGAVSVADGELLYGDASSGAFPFQP